MVKPMNKTVNMIYISLTGNTEAMLEAVAEGVREAGGVANLIKATESRGIADVVECDAMVWGTGNYYGYMEGLLKHWFDLYQTPLKKRCKKEVVPWKPYFAVCSAGKGGAKPLNTVDYLSWGMNLKKVFECELAFWKPSEEIVAACREKGRKLVELDVDKVENLYQPTERQLRGKSEW
jgi:multimeric flavodoxin WrbA